MATKQRSRSRRSSSRDRPERYVAPVLDPTWQSPYLPSAEERRANQLVVRNFARRKRMPQTIFISLVVVAAIVGVVALWWLPIIGIAVALLYGWDLRRYLRSFESRGDTMGTTMID